MARKIENRSQFSARVDTNTPEKIKALAFRMGYTYNKEGSPGALLDAIANGDVILFKKVE
jgi:hypothetical protein